MEKDVVKIVLDELSKRGFIKNDSISFTNTEKLLYSYNSLKLSIKNHLEEIDDLVENGLPEKSKSIVLNPGSGFNKDVDPVEQSIASINKTVEITKATLKHINKVLNNFKDDPYYEIIPLKYFEKKTYEEIAEYFDKKSNKVSGPIAVSTISKNKTRLINEIRILLIPNIYVNELLR